MRLTDLDKFEQFVERFCERAAMYRKNGAHLVLTEDRLRQVLSNMPVIDAETKWISVEERLPENGQEVLCWYEYFRFGDYNRMYRTYGIGYCFNGYWGGEVSNGQRCKVLAWMPLPEPPEDFPDIEEDDHETV